MNITNKIRDGSRESFLGWTALFLGISILAGNILAGLVGALMITRKDLLEPAALRTIIINPRPKLSPRLYARVNRDKMNYFSLLFFKKLTSANLQFAMISLISC